MSTKDLDAAGITDPALRVAYEKCRELHSGHGKTYYLATLLLPRAKRPYVWALYGFARYADEFVDSLTDPDPLALVRWGDAFLDVLQTDPTRPAGVDPRTDAVGAAMEDTMRRWGIPREHVEAFLESMRMDITETGYQTYADLERYMYGSAAVIGLQMLPVLEPLTPEAAPRARALGEAFQMSNFIRDVGEDLKRGRVYLPQEDLRLFGVTTADLAAGQVTLPVRRLLQFEIERTRALYAYAEPGIDMLDPTSRDCMRTAFELYGGILGAVERADYQVLTQRVSVSGPRRLQVAVPGLVRAFRARSVARRAPATPTGDVEDRDGTGGTAVTRDAEDATGPKDATAADRTDAAGRTEAADRTEEAGRTGATAAGPDVTGHGPDGASGVRTPAPARDA